MIDVAAIDELAPGQPKHFRLEGRDVVVVRWGARVYAMRDICPHQSRALNDGVVKQRVDCTDYFGEFAVDESAPPVIYCPWHNWQFDLSSGRCIADPKQRVKTYATHVKDGRVLVEISR